MFEGLLPEKDQKLVLREQGLYLQTDMECKLNQSGESFQCFDMGLRL